VGRGGVFPIPQQAARGGVAAERFGSGHHPERLVVGGDQQLTRSRVGQFVSLELSPDVGGVFGPQIDLGRAVPVGALDDDSLRLHVKLREFLFGWVGVIVVAGVDADFDVGVDSRINFRGGVKAVGRELKCG